MISGRSESGLSATGGRFLDAIGLLPIEQRVARVPTAMRRQLTLIFVDLVVST
jgi:hypothetical protein